MMLDFHVLGRPRPQGSKNVGVNPHSGRAFLKEASQGLRDWRIAVKYAARDAMLDADLSTFTGPVLLRVRFYFPRPKAHYLPVNKQREEPELRKGAARRPTGKPDVSKLVRAVEDAMTDAGVWADDSLVVSILAGKTYAPLAGARIQVYREGTATFSVESVYSRDESWPPRVAIMPPTRGAAS